MPGLARACRLLFSFLPVSSSEESTKLETESVSFAHLSAPPGIMPRQ